MQQLQTAK